MRGPLLAVFRLTGLAFAGCIDGQVQSAQQAEPHAFKATYWVEPGYRTQAHETVLTFGQIVDFLGRDGGMHRGYQAHVDHGSGSVWIGQAGSVFDMHLELQRQSWCNGWAKDGVCTGTQYDWGESSWAWESVRPAFGILHNLGASPEPGAETVVIQDGLFQWTFALDGALAPITVHRLSGGGTPIALYATRISYEATGALEPLGPITYDEARFGQATVESLVPGADAYPGGDAPSILDALAFIRTVIPDADQMLTAGGCVKDVSIMDRDPDWDRGTLEPAYDKIHYIYAFTINDVDASETRAFEVSWGQRAVIGTYDWLEFTEIEPNSYTETLDGKASQPVVQDVAQAFAQLGPLFPVQQDNRFPDFRYYTIGWEQDGSNVTIRYLGAGGGLWSEADEVEGGLSYTRIIRGHDIDA